MDLITKSRSELELAGLFDKDSDYNGMVGNAVMELIEVFSKQEHSGFSAHFVLNVFNKLAKHGTLTPLTGKDEEWFDCDEQNRKLYQNNRNFAVFKEGEDGKPYYIDAYIFENQYGNRFTGRVNLKDGRAIGKCYIKDFNNMPTVTINVLEFGKNNEIESWIKDETELEKLAKYYDFEVKSTE